MFFQKLTSFKIRSTLMLYSAFWGQGAILFAARIIAMILAFISAPLVVNALGADDYGRMAFAMGLVNWLNLIFTFGLDSVPKLLANLDDEEAQRRIIGGFFVLTTLMGALFVVILLILSQFVDQMFQTASGVILATIWPLVWVLPLQLMVEWMFYGVQKPLVLSLIVVVPRLLYFLAIVGLTQAKLTSAENFYLALLLSSLSVPVIGWFSLQPSFQKLGESLQICWQDIKGFGQQAFIGRVPAVMAYDLDRIILGWSSNARQVGFYNLAISFAMPIAMIGQSMAQVAYRDFATARSISRKQLQLMIGLSIAGAGLAAIFGTVLIIYFFPVDFRASIGLLLILCVSAAFQAIYAPVNSFISVKGKGKLLRQMGWVYTIGSLVLNLTLIPLLGAVGAALGTALINAIWLGQCYWYYQQLRLK